MAVDPRVMDLLQKLVAKQTSLKEIGTEGALNEAAVTASKIAELMLRHKIAMDLDELIAVEASSPIEREVYEYGPKDRYRARTRQAWEVRLANIVARAHDCRTTVGRGYLTFVGRAADRYVAVAMFRILRREVTLACDFGYKEERKKGHETRGYIASFFLAANAMIEERYIKSKFALVQETDSSALVLRTDQGLEEWLDANVPRRVTTASRGSFSTRGARAGAAFGKNVGLNSAALGEADSAN